MRVWLVTIGEPLPVLEGQRDRPHRTGYFAEYLASRGHDVVWWTSTFDHWRKKHVFQTDTVLGIHDRLRVNFMKGSGYRNNLSFARIRDHRQVARKFSDLARLEVVLPDVLVAALPTIELSLEAVRFGERTSVPVVLDMRDMWPDIFVDSLPLILRPFARLATEPMFRDARAACSGAAAITGITDEFVDWGVMRGCRERTDLDRSFPLGHTSVSPAEADLLKAERFWDEKGILADRSQLTVCFIGTLGRQSDLQTVLGAARRLKQRGAKTRFVVCGSGDRGREVARLGAGLENVILPGWIDAAGVYVLMRRSHVGLDPVPDRYDYLCTVNNKAIEYLSASLPVISSPKKGTLYQLLRKQGCGLSYDIRDAGGLVDLLFRLDEDREELQKLSRNAGETFRIMFTAEQVYGAMMKYLEEVVAKKTMMVERSTDGEAYV